MTENADWLSKGKAPPTRFTGLQRLLVVVPVTTTHDFIFNEAFLVIF